MVVLVTDYLNVALGAQGQGQGPGGGQLGRRRGRRGRRHRQRGDGHAQDAGAIICRQDYNHAQFIFAAMHCSQNVHDTETQKTTLVVRVHRPARICTTLIFIAVYYTSFITLRVLHAAFVIQRLYAECIIPATKVQYITEHRQTGAV